MPHSMYNLTLYPISCALLFMQTCQRHAILLVRQFSSLCLITHELYVFFVSYSLYVLCRVDVDGGFLTFWTLLYGNDRHE